MQGEREGAFDRRFPWLRMAIWDMILSVNAGAAYKSATVDSVVSHLMMPGYESAVANTDERLIYIPGEFADLTSVWRCVVANGGGTSATILGEESDRVLDEAADILSPIVLHLGKI